MCDDQRRPKQVAFLALRTQPGQFAADTCRVQIGRHEPQVGCPLLERGRAIPHRRRGRLGVVHERRDARGGQSFERRQSVNGRLKPRGSRGVGLSVLRRRPDAKQLELGIRVTELGEPHPARGQAVVVDRGERLAVDQAEEPFFLHPHGQLVPIARVVVRRWHLAEHLPLEDRRPVEPGDPQLAGRWVEAVMTVAAVGVKREPRGPRLVTELHVDRQFER